MLLSLVNRLSPNAPLGHQKSTYRKGKLDPKLIFIIFSLMLTCVLS